MSKFKEIIEIMAPVYINPKPEGVQARETYHSDGHVCSCCKGNRWFWGEDEMGERVKRDCPVCEGRGSLDSRDNRPSGPHQQLTAVKEVEFDGG